METAAILWPFHGAVLPNQQASTFREKLVVAPISSSPIKSTSLFSRGLRSSTVSRRGLIIVKASEITSDVASEKISQDPVENKSVQKPIFPNGFEALVLNVCDETSIAELKLKVGTFEMHLKRDIESPVPPVSAAAAADAPPVSSEPTAAQPPVMPQKSAPAPSSPFTNTSSAKASKLAALEASGAKSYALVSSPTVGTFRSGRTLKGKKQPPSCKEGDMIKEGQTIGYLDQFGSELPIKSDVAGEILKLLFKDGEAVGYGDPLVAVLPSFRGIQ